MKKIAVLLLSLSILFAVSAVPAMASEVPPASVGQTVSPQTAENVWYERTLENGKKQKRLWSITYERWLTDWIDC